jgi:hypothetical protein
MDSTVQRRIAAMALISGLLAASALGYSQVRPDTRPVLPLVLSGSDIGFRVEGRRGASAVGRFVVRLDGQWVEVEPRFGPKVVTGGVQN